jgi:diacylglycerol kinase (ATP)
MRTCAIVNPAAGGGRVRRLWPALAPRLREMVPNLIVKWTTAPGDATALTRTAVRRGAERIVAVGGDGTLHEVVNGFFATDGTPLSPAPVLTPLACGTGTDFRRGLGVPAAPAALERLSSPRTRSVDLLRVTYTSAVGEPAYRYALNVVSMGFSGRVVHRLQRDRGLLPFARLRYVEALLRVLAAHRPFRAALEVDGTPVPASVLHLVAVANGPSFGAGLRIAPDAVLDDGRLDVTVLHDVSALALLGQLHHFYRGTHPSLRGVTTRRGRRLRIRPRQAVPVLVEADGELLGRLPATVETMPDALRLQY